ncbi:MAG: aconitate hydratase AcnA [Candidatus Hodarchaeales archaeon]|jgi:aconitate hydratase
MIQITREIIESTKMKKDFGLGEVTYYSLKMLEERSLVDLDKLPFSIRVLLENMIRNFDGHVITVENVNAYANWPKGQAIKDVPYMPSRVLLQDFTGVPLLVDLAALREAYRDQGGDPSEINPKIPTDLVIDHSVQVDYHGSSDALLKNVEKEYERNSERYQLLKWAQQSFKGMRVVPTASGICHQVNLEYLSPLVDIREFRGEKTAVIDTIVGTDSHTPMINGLGVLGWGVGGIEAEAVMLGQPYFLVLPEVIGVHLVGELQEGVTATDLVLTITEMLRKKGVVEKFVEYYGPGLSSLTVPDRATITNMTPECGHTCSYFPIDEVTREYLRFTGRDVDHISFVEKYAKEQRLMRMNDIPDPVYTEVIELDLSSVKPSSAGPRNPEERTSIPDIKERLNSFIDDHNQERNRDRMRVTIELDGEKSDFQDGDVVIAAITSCTNTSNPSVMIGAGLLAKKAVKAGLSVNPLVKTSCAPGSRVVTQYLKKLNLERYLEELGFHTVGYGCTTCIGNSGPLKAPIAEAITKNDLYICSVLSGNRNFSGRVHQLTRGNFLASPILVVAYALAGTMNIDLDNEPLGKNGEGKEIFLKDIWPSREEIEKAINDGITPEMFKEEYGRIFDGDEIWNALEIQPSILFDWDPESEYVRLPPYFDGYTPVKKAAKDIKGARVLVMASEKVSTDHISPAGAIAKDSPAGKYLQDKGISVEDFNTYGSRRGNHEVMMRGTFANILLRNQLAEGKEGWWTKDHLSGSIDSVYDTAMKYKKKNIPAIILGSNQYGQGSSRDWGAKGPLLQGVKAVIAKAFERIHRSNLIGMGIIPLEFESGEGWQELGLNGTEIYNVTGMSKGLKPRMKVQIEANKEDGSKVEFSAKVRLDTAIEIDYYQHGGILQYVLSKLLEM